MRMTTSALVLVSFVGPIGESVRDGAGRPDDARPASIVEPAADDVAAGEDDAGRSRRLTTRQKRIFVLGLTAQESK
jgi:hypothetical protein